MLLVKKRGHIMPVITCLVSQPVKKSKSSRMTSRGSVFWCYCTAFCRHIEESITIQNISKNDCITIFQDYESDPKNTNTHLRSCPSFSSVRDFKYKLSHTKHNTITFKRLIRSYEYARQNSSRFIYV